ncbi:enoyl-CoA hydratase/isomerase family protein [Xylanimonas protaetiae]|uniref:Enoyl-CoA hydratase/isomerase family protein n=1 Tax=Xylanimonas protaetiae TaxID=2509457 RepID=A0A4P6FL74_9MICO|nr:enoyl-CoA hydratase/isomerase family protein [Xylanimonas protaetiae]QAY71388.1 enoyl-CoA hydratase/isomerase family protein [Xylanimonas protaetiae]
MIRSTIDDDVAEIVLDAPGRLNALDEDGLAELDEAVAEARRARARALLLRGEGRAFCAGRDVSAVDPATDDALGFLAGRVAPVMRHLADFPAPTYAVAHGACLGVGLGLLIAADVVLVADDAKIGSPFAGLGATLDSGGHALFYERLGAHRTLDLIYSGRLMTGAEAVAAGLFSRVLPAGTVLDEARAAARAAASGPTQAFVASKRLVASLRDQRLGLWESMDAENRAQAVLSGTDDYREGFAAFQAKRRPEFSGRATAGGV